ncbi:MAG: DUF433 domain-containing protein [Acidobacteria bacterium]|nr:DUF433 domain-containing protein [Acidobacteriota bacterium]
MHGYTPAQAAAITGLPLGAIHKAIDSRLIRPRTDPAGSAVRRLISTEQLLYLQLEADGVRLLPVGTRREIAASVQRSPGTDKLPVANGPALMIDVGSARRRVERRMKEMARLENLVVSDPEILRGTPVFKGTRIPVELVADMLAQGATPGEILRGYPTLSKAKIALAPLYMRAFPRRGRPSRRPWQGSKALGRMAFPLNDGLHSA